ncbi:hypothetical protein QYE76_002553 [Lolium multiflorum]|uniref:Uncharacterized protein n=1 Tax=Lolium multiflorum TaxID=4521 RepID=A0AAD8RNE5_LOLMU|nr:hypothetical protein QYE76_002553 [Lolium multiflorum]
MGARRFLNLLVTNRRESMYSLSRFDLSRDQFFYTNPEEVASRGRDLHLLLGRDVEKRFSPNMRRKKRKQQDVAEKIGTFRLPAPVVNMRPTPFLTALYWQQNQLHCFPLSERNFLFADARGCMFSYLTDLSCVVTMPSLHAPKEYPLQFTISHNEGTTGDCTIYIIEQIIRREHDFPFEALVSKSRRNLHPLKAWQCDSTLPLPPYVSEEGYQATLSPICASAVIDNRFICISVLGAGTYCFDTATRAWSRAGDWMLPFRGMAEYVPELNLWFGAYKGYNLLCAADLSTVVRGQPPERSFIWEDSTGLPEDWIPCVSSSKLVSLGSRRFCVARLFRKMVPSKDDVDSLTPVSLFTVLTGLEVLLPGKGKGSGKLRMVKHKSRRFIWSDAGLIASLF